MRTTSFERQNTNQSKKNIQEILTKARRTFTKDHLQMFFVAGCVKCLMLILFEGVTFERVE